MKSILMNKNTEILITDYNTVLKEFDELLHKYQNITKMTDRRINKICTLLSSRINKLKNIIDESN